MAQEPTDRRRRPSVHMVKAESYFFSNWPLQLLPSRPLREPRRTNRDRTRATCAPLLTHTRRVCCQHRPMGVNVFRNGQLCAWPFTNKISVPPSDFCGQQTVNRAETVHSTSASCVRRDQPAAILCRSQECGNARSRIEARPAQPVDGTITADQGCRLAVADQSVIFDPLSHCVALPLACVDVVAKDQHRLRSLGSEPLSETPAESVAQLVDDFESVSRLNACRCRSIVLHGAFDE